MMAPRALRRVALGGVQPALAASAPASTTGIRTAAGPARGHPSPGHGPAGARPAPAGPPAGTLTAANCPTICRWSWSSRHSPGPAPVRHPCANSPPMARRPRTSDSTPTGPTATGSSPRRRPSCRRCPPRRPACPPARPPVRRTRDERRIRLPGRRPRKRRRPAAVGRLPYICLAVFVVGHVWRCCQNQFGWPPTPAGSCNTAGCAGAASRSTWREGSKGPMASRFAVPQVRSSGKEAASSSTARAWTTSRAVPGAAGTTTSPSSPPHRPSSPCGVTTQKPVRQPEPLPSPRRAAGPAAVLGRHLHHLRPPPHRKQNQNLTKQPALQQSRTIRGLVWSWGSV